MWRNHHHDPKAEALVAIPLWSGMSADEAEEIARASDDLSLPAGARLCRDGTRAREVFLILEGTAIARREGRLLGRASAGAFVGEMGVIDGEVRSADVEAESDVRVLVFTAAGFKDLMDSVPGLTRRAMAEMVGRIRRAQSDVPAVVGES